MASNGNSNEQSGSAHKEKILFKSDRRGEAQNAGEAERRTDVDRRKFLRPTMELRKMGFVVALVIFLVVVLVGFLMR